MTIKGVKLFTFFIENLFGFQLFRIALGYLISRQRKSDNSTYEPWFMDLCLILVMQLMFFTLISSFLPWTYYFWFWFLPWLTINRFIAGLRSIAEHQPLHPRELHPFTRTLKPTWIDRWIFCRVGFDYHWAHHRYPTIPWFRLADIDHSEDPTSQQTDGYLAILRKHVGY